ncbi:chemotaxis protein [Paenibacillus chitinolyticus]|uniref:Chemotaxis protein n=1 Tax=Paenibacillus chitinolyticus TaxID=79263 RepID=A0A410WYH2_9BACL|nr:methyl-accepting chemotaxis protein [Paenibacillus chitinolyticus]MCY9590555.1 methyl-accepting chemotaxis protein [Paenibacillus chitinolyticus]MCY9596450.1 methyl-accepting chemotaxis protein [Paenibacillus chitinolyticus]QAV19464.1 chemotaxis protein [Paenibacillus chitinolyticus]
MNNVTEAQTQHELIRAFVKVAPLLSSLNHDDITIGIYDTEKLIINIPGKTFSLNVSPGDPLMEGDIVTNAIRNNTPLTAVVPKELFGFPLAARAIPLHDEQGRVIGGVGMGTSLEKANKLFEMAESFSAIVEQTTASIGDISQSVSNLTDRVTDVTHQMQDVSSSAQQIGKISAVVKEISDQSNMLGLNAAIEAARAGEVGRGFSVVADEIRKLATSSKENVDQINGITKNIQELLLRLNHAFSDIYTLTDTQSKAIREFSATIQEISTKAEDLAQVAEATLYSSESKQ